jgi:hypothetical protein
MRTEMMVNGRGGPSAARNARAEFQGIGKFQATARVGRDHINDGRRGLSNWFSPD